MSKVPSTHILTHLSTTNELWTCETGYGDAIRVGYQWRSNMGRRMGPAYGSPEGAVEVLEWDLAYEPIPSPSPTPAGRYLSGDENALGCGPIDY